MPTLHVHLDESGDLRFRPTSTKFYVFTVAWTYDPAPLARAITTLRFQLLKQGHNLRTFHASEDKQVNRDAVVDLLAAHPDWHFAAVVVEKAKVFEDLRPPHRFYPQFASSALKYIFHRHVRSETKNILVFTDTLPVKEHREAAEKAIKTTCRRELPESIGFHSYHHPSHSNAWIQVVDYCSWAVFKKWEHGDLRTYDRLKHRMIEPELDALHRGEVRFY